MKSPPVHTAKTTTGVSRSLLRFARNAGSVLASDVFYRATTFALYLLVARYLGTFEFGQLSLALTLFYTFQVVAVAGLKTLITREVAKDPTTTDRYLINGSALVLVTSLFAIMALAAFVWLMGYARETSIIILLLSLGLIPYALTAICEAVFQAWERMHFIAYAHIPANIAKLALAFLLLTQGYHVPHLVLLIATSLTLTAGCAWWLMLRHIRRPQLTLDIGFAWKTIRATVPFLGIDVVIALWASLQIILLSALASETDVGLFNSTAQLIVPVTLIFKSLVESLFPSLCRHAERSPLGLERISKRLVELLLGIALPTAIALFFLAEPLLLVLYSDQDFLSAAAALRIMAWILIFRALTSALGQVLLASRHEQKTLRIVSIDTLLSLAFGVVLIANFGILGAAMTKLLTSIINFAQHYYSVSKLVGRLGLLQLAWKPLVASLSLIGCFLALQPMGDIPAMIVAGAVYILTLIALDVIVSGGFRPFALKYQRLLFAQTAGETP